MASYYVAMDDNYAPLGIGMTRNEAIRDTMRDGEFKRSDLRVYECTEQLYKKLLIPGWVDIGGWSVNSNGFADIELSE